MDWEKIKEKSCFDSNKELIQVCFADKYIQEQERMLLNAFQLVKCRVMV